MQFRQGMLGVAIVAVAIASALMGSWIMSMDVEERSVTVYNPLMDVTGLFDSDLAPEYTEYSPTTNYTGYYTSSTIIDGVKYFGGVDYVEASRPNNYRLLLPPTSNTVTTVDLSQLTGDEDDDYKMHYWTDNGTPSVNGSSVEHLTIPELLTALSIETSGNLQVTLMDPFSTQDYQSGGFITFITADMLMERSNVFDTWYAFYMKDPSLTGQLKEPVINYDKYIPAADVTNPILAAVYDSTTNSVQLYYDVAMTEMAGTYTPDAVSICWQNSGFLGDSVYIDAKNFPPYSYMDPTKGVQLE